MATYQELLAQKQALEAQIEEARASELASVIEQIRGLMMRYELSQDDIALRRRRGRLPLWLPLRPKGGRCRRSTRIRRLARPGPGVAARRHG